MSDTNNAPKVTDGFTMQTGEVGGVSYSYPTIEARNAAGIQAFAAAYKGREIREVEVADGMAIVVDFLNQRVLSRDARSWVDSASKKDEKKFPKAVADAVVRAGTLLPLPSRVKTAAEVKLEAITALVGGKSEAELDKIIASLS